MADGLAVTSAYLEVLEAQRADLITALEPVVSSDDIAVAHRTSARLSVRLDASPLSDATADEVDGGTRAVPGRGLQRRNGEGWAAALRLEGMPTQDIAAMEYRGVRAAQADEPRLAARFLDAPVETLERVHRDVMSGLVVDDRVGVLRRTSRAVHDGAQGRAIYHAPPPSRLPALLADLDGWVRGAHASVSPLALAGVVHARVLQWRPFEAGNGRIARLASRLVLRATGGDPWGLSTPERSYLADPLGYAKAIAATIRRRTDMRPWNELTAEAVVDGLERVARAHAIEPPDVDPDVFRAAITFTPRASVTLPELAGAARLDLDAARVQCNRLCWSGVLRRDPGTGGLRYELRRPAMVSDRAGSIGPI